MDLRKLLVAFVFVICAGLRLAGAAEDPLLKAKLSDLTGRPSLSEIKFDLSRAEGKWVLLELWASWCKPCRDSFPFFERLYQENQNQGFLVVGLAMDDDKKDSLHFLSQNKTSFPILYDEGKHLRKLWQISSLPMTVWMNPQGEVVQITKGFRKSDQKRVEKQVQDFLKQKGEKK
ncbi:MAG: TlpA disulfide reductase family protein [Bdellovibrionales bacterium]